MEQVGRVVGVWRYPVKSMAGEALAEAQVVWHGLAGDRRWAFVQEGQVRSGFPWLTLRENPGLVRYAPSFVEPQRPDQSAVVVRTPSGATLDVTDPLLAAELCAGVRPLKCDRGLFDALPLSIVSLQTLAFLGERVGVELDQRRFRPNLVVDAAGPFAEDGWVGAELLVGDVAIRVDARDGRCVVITLDPVTGEADPAILRVVAQERQARLGVYGSTVQPGRVAVGDPVFLRSGGDR